MTVRLSYISKTFVTFVVAESLSKNRTGHRLIKQHQLDKSWHHHFMHCTDLMLQSLFAHTFFLAMTRGCASRWVRGRASRFAASRLTSPSSSTLARLRRWWPVTVGVVAVLRWLRIVVKSQIGYFFWYFLGFLLPADSGDMLILTVLSRYMCE